jgi:hypothetical protein
MEPGALAVFDAGEQLAAFGASDRMNTSAERV